MKKALTIVAMLTLSGTALAQDPPKVAPSPSPPAAVETLKVAAGPDFGEAAAGEVIYLRYCAACHGKSLKGDGPVAAGLVKKPIDLTELAKKNGGTFPYDKTAASIDGRMTTRMHGNPDMPVWGEIFSMTSGTDAPNADSAVKRITHYVWSNQTKAPATPTPEKK
jgi:mono/diheme cytochrome c family protein